MRYLRRAVQALVLISFAILLPLTLIGLWARSEIYDTDTYLESVGNLASNEEVQEAVAHRIVTEAERQLSGTSWEEFLDDAVLDPNIKATLLESDGSVGALLESAIVQVMQTPEFQQLWIDINRQIHPLIEQILRGEDSEIVESSGGEVRLNLYPVYREAESALFGDGIDLDAAVDLGREDLEITLFEGGRLVQAQEAVRLLNQGLVVALVLLISLPILLLIVSRRRWLAMAAFGVAIVIGMAIHALMLRSARTLLTDAAESATERDAVRIVFDEITESLWVASGIVALAGLAILALFLIGHVVRRRQHDPYSIDW